MSVIKPIRCVIEILVDADANLHGYFMRFSNPNNDAYLFVFLINGVACAFSKHCEPDSMMMARNECVREWIEEGSWVRTICRTERLELDELTEFERFKKKWRNFMNDTALESIFNFVGNNMRELVSSRKIEPLNAYNIQTAHSTLGAW